MPRNGAPMHATPRLALVLAAVAALVLGAAPALAAGGSPRLQTFFQGNLSTAYQQKVYNRVAQRWTQPAQTPAVGKKSVVVAFIAKDGKLISAELKEASGSKAWDAAALAAVKKAAPFDPVPAGFSSPTVELHVHVAWAAK
jgi:protein TonB